jgi:hypothetical protein
MLTDETRKAVNDAVGLVADEGFTFCGFAVKQNDDGTASIQPFTNHPTVPEFVYNLLSGAGLLADGIWNTDSIEAALKDLQKQSIKVNEA